jgi:hypothetical protein
VPIAQTTPEPGATTAPNATPPAATVTPAPSGGRSSSLCGGAFLAPLLVAIPFLLRRRK